MRLADFAQVVLGEGLRGCFLVEREVANYGGHGDRPARSGNSDIVGLVPVDLLWDLGFDEPHHELFGRQILVMALLEKLALGRADRHAPVSVVGNPSVPMVLDQQGKIALKRGVSRDYSNVTGRLGLGPRN